MAYKIRSDIPIPDDGAVYTTPIRHNQTDTYPFGAMEIGDSFLVPSNDVRVAKVRSAASKYGRRWDKVFLCRRLPTGVRCWRIQ